MSPDDPLSKEAGADGEVVSGEGGPSGLDAGGDGAVEDGAPSAAADASGDGQVAEAGDPTGAGRGDGSAGDGDLDAGPSEAEAAVEPGCPEGTVQDGDGCQNLDECFLGTHECHVSSQCRDLDPGYTCDCPAGYSGGGSGGFACVPRISLGQGYLCETESSGKVYCWGDNSEGQLGDGTQTTRDAPTEVKGLSNAVAVEAGVLTTCALLDDGRVSCWGQFAGTEWGPGNHEPVRLGGLSDIVQISVSGSSGTDTGCAVDRAGDVYCWGGNDEGQVGTGEATGIPVARPQHVEGLGPARRVDVGYGQSSVCATLRTGAAYCWGMGALTGPATTSSTVPVKVPSLDDAYQVIPAFGRTCVLRYQGYLRCWGAAALIDSDEMGPVQITGTGTALALAAGLYQTCVLNDDGELMCWNASTSPTHEDASESYLALDAFSALTAGLTTDGQVRVFNMNSAANAVFVDELSVALP